MPLRSYSPLSFAVFVFTACVVFPEFALYQAQLGSAHSQMAEIEANLRQAQADLKRQQEINARKLGTAAQLDAARAAAESLTARLASQRRQIKVSEQSLALAQVSLDDTADTAPELRLAALLAAALDEAGVHKQSVKVYTCGPHGMMAAVAATSPAPCSPASRTWCCG